MEIPPPHVPKAKYDRKHEIRAIIQFRALHKKELNANYHNVNVVYFECLPIFIQFYFMYAN